MSDQNTENLETKETQNSQDTEIIEDAVVENEEQVLPEQSVQEKNQKTILQQKTTPQIKTQPTQQHSQKTNPEDKPTLMTRFKSWLLEYKRVLRSTKKPNNQEFLTIVKVSGIGILVIGFIGFLISMLKELITKFF